jgi:hypothetical protein
VCGCCSSRPHPPLPPYPTCCSVQAHQSAGIVIQVDMARIDSTSTSITGITQHPHHRSSLDALIADGRTPWSTLPQPGYQCLSGTAPPGEAVVYIAAMAQALAHAHLCQHHLPPSALTHPTAPIPLPSRTNGTQPHTPSLVPATCSSAALVVQLRPKHTQFTFNVRIRRLPQRLDEALWYAARRRRPPSLHCTVDGVVMGAHTD